jgi:wyosine [tRNA(Phe)-imidazoG37] synthetase (radical SAM superfamily)
MLCINENDETAYAFGPVPSRRLGRSLGIVNVPSRTCTYDCIYCQLGQTTNMTLNKQPWYDVDTIIESIAGKKAQVRNLGKLIDYVTYVPNGEPTLDVNLEVEIRILRSIGIPTAIFTNASLIDRADVQQALQRFDRIIVKVDAIDEEIWRKINRPHEDLELGAILDGLSEFSRRYQGNLETTTMLVAGVNDSTEELERLATFIEQLNPSRAILSVPTRPPCENWVRIPAEKSLTRAYAIFTNHIKDVELLAGYEGDEFVLSSDVVGNLLAIVSVHPMRKSAVKAFIGKAGGHWGQIEKLVESGELVVVPYEGETYYLRRQKNKGED